MFSGPKLKVGQRLILAKKSDSFFGKKGPKYFTTLYSIHFLSVLIEIKIKILFTKRRKEAKDTKHSEANRLTHHRLCGQRSYVYYIE